MKIFTGNDAWLTPEEMISSLREIAREDGEKDEFHPAEHTCWIAADMIEKMHDVIHEKAPEIWLRELADRLAHNKWVPKEEEDYT